MPASFLEPVGDQFVPTAAAVGPWGPQTVSGMVVVGLVGHVAELIAGNADFIGTRLTVDMIRMAAMAEFTTSARIVREGRRLRLVDIAIEQNGKPVALGRAVFARRTATPSGQVWSDPVAMPPMLAADLWPGGGGLAFTAVDGAPNQDFDIWRDATQPKMVWFRMPIDLVAGAPSTSFVVASCIADVINPLTNWGSDGLQFVNSDVTMQLARLPEGDAIGLVARDRQADAGVSVAMATMHDHRGPIGICTTTALASEFQMRPPRLR